MIYVKALTKSDLTIIGRFWKPDLKQEAIVLSKPYMEALGESFLEMARGEIVSLDMNFFGPDAKGAITRKNASIGKQPKDWRLQSCSVEDPVDDMERFSQLVPGDLFVFSLNTRDEVKVGRGLFVAKNSALDSPLHKTLNRRKNVVARETTIESDIGGLHLREDHPIYSVINQSSIPYSVEVVPDSEFFDSLSAGPLGATGKKGKISKEELKKDSENAADIGYRGEKLFDEWLEGNPVINGFRVINHKWVAEEYATAPYDFDVHLENQEVMRVELKSTSGQFKNRIHISIGELKVLANPDDGGVLARLYDIDKEPAVRFAFNARGMAQLILENTQLPGDVSVDSYNAKPNIFGFGGDVELLGDTD